MEVTYTSSNPSDGDTEHTYRLREHLDGQAFLDLREDSSGSGRRNLQDYLFRNLLKRLESWTRPEAITDGAIRALPFDVFHILYNTAMRLEGKELEAANSFLIKLWGLSQPEGLLSESELSLDSIPAGSEESFDQGNSA